MSMITCVIITKEKQKDTDLFIYKVIDVKTKDTSILLTKINKNVRDTLNIPYYAK